MTSALFKSELAPDVLTEKEVQSMRHLVKTIQKLPETTYAAENRLVGARGTTRLRVKQHHFTACPLN